MGMGIVTNCCTHANDEDREKEKENEKNKADIQKIISSKSFVNKEEGPNSKMTARKFNSINYKPYVGISNYKESGFINVNLQILSRLTYFKDFVNIMGKTSKAPLLIQNFIKIMNNISQGIQLDVAYKNFIEEINEKHQFTEHLPINFHLFFLDKLCHTVYGSDLYFHEYKLGEDEISVKNVEAIKGNFSNEFSQNDIKLKFFTGFLNVNIKNCKNLKCNLKSQEMYSTTLPFIDLRIDSSEQFILQEKINQLYFDKQIEGKCERCGKINNKFIVNNKMLINVPKYLIIRLINKENISLDLSYLKNKQLVYFSKNYEIFSIISQVSTPGGEANSMEFSCTIKIDYKWINFNDDMITIVDEDNLFNNSYMLYFQLR
jgi:hypothetical protein